MSVSGNGTAMPGIRLPSGREHDLPGLQPEDGDVLRGEPGDGPAAGSGGGEGSADLGVLARSIHCRLPAFTDEMSARQRAEILADHILQTAIVRGELAELRMEAQVKLRSALAEFERAGSFRPSKTAKANEQMRREQNPDLAKRIDDAKWIIARCGEEMDRLGGSDYDAASRAYTILTGG